MAVGIEKPEENNVIDLLKIQYMLYNHSCRPDCPNLKPMQEPNPNKHPCWLHLNVSMVVKK